MLVVFCEYSKLRLCDISVGEFSKVLGGYVFIFSSLAGGASMWWFMRICAYLFQLGSRGARGTSIKGKHMIRRENIEEKMKTSDMQNDIGEGKKNSRRKRK